MVSKILYTSSVLASMSLAASLESPDFYNPTQTEEPLTYESYVTEKMDHQKKFHLEQRNRNRNRDWSDNGPNIDYNIFRGVDRWSMVEFFVGMSVGAYDTL